MTAGGGQANIIYADVHDPLGNKDWTGTWKVATGFGHNLSWQAEVVIPFSDLGLQRPRKGDVWQGGFFRQGGTAGLSGWIYKGGKFYDYPNHFGDLIFSP